MNDQAYHSGWILTNHSFSTENVPMVWYWTLERKQSKDHYIPDKSGGRKSTFCLEEPFLKDNEASLHRWCFLCRSAYQNRLGMVCNCVRCLNHITLWLDLSTGESLKEVILSMMFEVFPKQKWHPSNSFDNRCSLMGQLICGPPEASYFFPHSQTLLLKQVFTQLKFRIQNPLRIPKIHFKIHWASSFRISKISYCTIKYSTSYNNKNYPHTHKTCKNLCGSGGDWF